jgi:hypothetical protein
VKKFTLYTKHIAVLSLSEYSTETTKNISFFDYSEKTLPVVEKKV